MATEIQQDVDAIRLDTLNQRIIAQSRSIKPGVCQALEGLGGPIALMALGITEDLKVAAVDPFQDRAQKKGDGVITQIPGDQAKSQDSPWIAIGHSQRHPLDPCRLLVFVGTMFGKDLFARDVRLIVQTK